VDIGALEEGPVEEALAEASEPEAAAESTAEPTA
jgi:hypothetical protein